MIFQPDGAGVRPEEVFVRPDSGAALAELAVVVREALGDPEPLRDDGAGEVPRPQPDGAQTLDVPVVEELVRRRAERRVEHAAV